LKSITAVIGAVSLVLLSAGCAQMTDTGVEMLEIRTDRAEYALGDTARVTFTNIGSEPVGCSDRIGCIATVQRQTGDSQWLDIIDPDCGIVTIKTRTLPGDSFVQEFAMESPTFEIGTVYRWRLNVAEESRHLFIGWHSNAFWVVESR
jgi:hypothetical protein